MISKLKLIKSFVVVLSALVFGGFPFVGTAQPKKPTDWADIDAAEIKMKDRAALRPGNINALLAINDFLTGMYEVKPVPRSCGFPFQFSNSVCKSADEFAKHVEEKTKGTEPPHNTLRNYILTCRSVRLYQPTEVNTDNELKKAMRFHNEKYEALRNLYPGDGLLVLVNVDLESLHSTKIESGTDVMFLVRDGSKWKVVWWSHG